MRIGDMPKNVQDSYNNYKSGTKKNPNDTSFNSGNAPSGAKAGRDYNNNNNLLPKVDENGNSITYKEYDVNSSTPGSDRDGERFVVGSDGSEYYTNTHYGDNGDPAFIKIEE